MKYVLDEAKKELTAAIEKAIKNIPSLKGIEFVDIKDLIRDIPKDKGCGFSLMCMAFSDASNAKNNYEIAKELEEKINASKLKYFNNIKNENGYLNFYFNTKKINQEVINNFQKLGTKYGMGKSGKDKTIIIDYSAPNIAKPFSIGHLRTTIIGQALYNIYESQGYKVIGDNHIGDWGTQFGKLITAYKKWGDRTKINQDPIKELLNLYIKFHKEAEIEPVLNDEAREWFKKLECGDSEARKIWQWMRDVSLEEFNVIYDMLGIKFDETLGESFYEDKMDEIVKMCEKKDLAKWVPALDENQIQTKNEKVLMIDLKKYGIKTPALLKKSDGTTLYFTRDLATAKYRIKTWNPKKIIYVVGSEQKLYFRQLFKVLELLGYDSKLFEHIYFGLINLSEGKMSTRAGRVIFLKDVLDEAIERVKNILVDRNLSKEEKAEIAGIVGIGAIKYADLSQDKKHNILFDWKRILNLKGNSGPYLQYQYVRIGSILAKGKFNKNNKVNSELLIKDEEKKLIQLMMHFNENIKNITVNHQVHNLANYLYELATEFSRFYEKVPVLKAENKDLKATRLYLCFMCSQILKSGLNLLGIEVPEKM